MPTSREYVQTSIRHVDVQGAHGLHLACPATSRLGAVTFLLVGSTQQAGDGGDSSAHYHHEETPAYADTQPISDAQEAHYALAERLHPAVALVSAAALLTAVSGLVAFLYRRTLAAIKTAQAGRAPPDIYPQGRPYTGHSDRPRPEPYRVAPYEPLTLCSSLRRTSCPLTTVRRSVLWCRPRASINIPSDDSKPASAEPKEKQYVPPPSHPSSPHRNTGLPISQQTLSSCPYSLSSYSHLSSCTPPVQRLPSSSE
ncbi:hypothetical protein L7F22_013430, partial [Adiantum nelumboides]|nr:hypothetical protein [Adiantum nelumboides]